MWKRRPTPVNYSREEIRVIRHMLTAWLKPPVCPRCDSELRLRDGISSEGSTSWHVQCLPCQRGALIDREYAGNLDPAS
jgi:transposase-like protein